MTLSRAPRFPYTALFRSSLALVSATRAATRCWYGRAASRSRARSEEHTSELQSRENLVCRLLLEKKNSELGLPLVKAIMRLHGGALDLKSDDDTGARTTS